MTVLIDMSERCAHGGFERIVGNEGKGSSRAFLSGRALDDALDRHLLVCKSSGDGCNLKQLGAALSMYVVDYDGGCSDAAILTHGRQARHYRGCWLLDAVLGKS